MIRRLALATLLLLGLGLPAGADQAAIDAEARAALQAFFDATYSQDPARVAAILAPEFQLARSDGTGHGLDYAQHLPTFTKAGEFSDILATEAGDSLVVRYTVKIGVVIDGKMAEAQSPRLTVFRRIDGIWKVVAHANFAHLQQ